MIYLPAIMQTAASPNMSDRYVHVSTPNVIDVMQEAGFSVVDQKVDKVRVSDPAFARHAVIFRSENLGISDGTFVPQAIFMNSHNGKSTASLRLGLYRFVCANGLVVGNDYASTSIKHIGDLAHQVIERIKEMSKQSSEVFKKIESWSKVDLSREQRIQFASKAAELRFGVEKSKQYNIADILQPRRFEDDRGDLWGTFNIIQENTTKGGLIGRNANNRRIQSKSLNSIGQDLSFNKSLWELAESFV